ncbi:MAG: FAD-dependent oxidoreductase, partial [Burkholderiaceae bacterium]
MTRREQFDVVVIGAGMAGLCAAVAALERGASVLVLEKGSRIGGSMLLSNGLIWTFASKDQLREDVPDGNKALQELLIESLPDSLDWLESQGVALQAEQTFQWYGWGRRSTPVQMAPALAERVQALGGRIRMQTAMQSLMTRDDAVTGVVAADHSGSIEIEAGAVILASGGFQGNAEMLARYAIGNADSIYLRSNPCSTGDGLAAATRIGAATTTHLDVYYGHAMVAPPARFSALEFQSASQKYGNLALALDLNGRRFADESAGTGEEDINFRIGQCPQATAVYVVDAEMADMESPNNPPPRAAIGRARQYGGRVIEAASLEELATALGAWGLPPDEVLKTLRQYNDAVESGRCEHLVPPRTRSRFALKKAPFTAVLVRSSITYTCGGLQTDLDMRVIRQMSSVSTMPLVIAPID